MGLGGTSPRFQWTLQGWQTQYETLQVSEGDSSIDSKLQIPQEF
jgi:hypothetical protein